jgi:hemolysin D
MGNVTQSILESETTGSGLTFQHSTQNHCCDVRPDRMPRIGFVHEGQKAAVKIDTFNFTKYGLIDAEILSISDDAIQDENLGLVYSARFKLHQEGLQIGDRWVRLSPGMSATSEIKTGKRRLIEYFLSPLLRYKQESVRER